MNTKSKRALIEVNNLFKSYDEGMVLQNINFEVHEGDLVSLIGPSGCGKSTLLRCLNCLEIIDSGTVRLDGLSLERPQGCRELDDKFRHIAHDIRERVGMVFQALNLFPHKTVLHNVSLAPQVVKGLSQSQAESLGLKQLDKVGLADYANRYPGTMSGGQQQRVAIARALAMSPKVMLYDEPTSSLDPERVEEVLKVMRDLDNDGMTQIIVTHEMPFARDASDYIIYMENGEIVEISDEDEIFMTPQDERTRRFLKRYMEPWQEEVV